MFLIIACNIYPFDKIYLSVLFKSHKHEVHFFNCTTFGGRPGIYGARAASATASTSVAAEQNSKICFKLYLFLKLTDPVRFMTKIPATPTGKYKTQISHTYKENFENPGETARVESFVNEGKVKSENQRIR